MRLHERRERVWNFQLEPDGEGYKIQSALSISLSCPVMKVKLSRMRRVVRARILQKTCRVGFSIKKGVEMVRSISNKSIIAMLLSMILLLGAFSTDLAAQRRTRRRGVHHSRTKGAIVGGLIGAGGGALIGGKKGAAIGAGAGAGTGYLVQRHRNRRHRRH
jgi:hypothetical protein